MRQWTRAIAILPALLWAASAWAQAPTYLGEWPAPGEPSAITIGPDGNLWVSMSQAGVVRKYTPGGQLLFTLGAPGTGPGEFRSPLGVAFVPSGDLFVADLVNDRVQRFSGTGSYLGEWTPRRSGTEAHPSFILYHPTQRLLYITNNSLAMMFYTTEGEYWGEVQVPYPDLYGLRGLALAPSGELFVAALVGGHVGRLSAPWPHPLQSRWPAGNGPNQIAVDGSNRLWVADYYGYLVRAFSPSGTPLFAFGGSGTGPGQFIGPSGIAIDANGTIYVADKFNHRIQIFGYAVPARTPSWGEVKHRYRRLLDSGPPAP